MAILPLVKQLTTSNDQPGQTGERAARTAQTTALLEQRDRTNAQIAERRKVATTRRILEKLIGGEKQENRVRDRLVYMGRSIPVDTTIQVVNGYASIDFHQQISLEVHAYLTHLVREVIANRLPMPA